MTQWGLLTKTCDLVLSDSWYIYHWILPVHESYVQYMHLIKATIWAFWSTYLFLHCSLWVLPCHSDHICSSCWLEEGSEKSRNLVEQQSIQPLSQTHEGSCIHTYHLTGLHKPLTAPWTSSQPLLCSLGFYQGATSRPAFCTCSRTEGRCCLMELKQTMLP